MVYTLLKSKFVLSTLRFSAVNGHTDTKDTLFRKQLMYFNVYIIGYYFHTGFILIVNCNINILAEAAIKRYFSKVAPKVIHKRIVKYRKY